MIWKEREMKAWFFMLLTVTGIFGIGCAGGTARTAEHAKTYYNRGTDYLKQGNYDLAIEELSQAIAIAPGLAEAYNNRGIAYEMKRDYDQAIRDFTKAIEIRPGIAAAYYNRGNASAERYIYSEQSGYDVRDWSRGDYDQAIRDYTKACDLGVQEACKRKQLPNLQPR
jgi:tetratricopeptide (TPR) repeat protein